MTTIQKSRNVHYINLGSGVKSMRYLLISDLHWDNPHCNRKLLKKHLDEAKRCGAKVIINGDLFCLMQGKADPRRIKSDIRPEHNNAKYFDSIVKTAVEWFAPYAECLELVGYGNHETSIIRHQETDILQRFVERINAEVKPNDEVQLGGYGGFLATTFTEKAKNSKSMSYRYLIKYFHGYGGGGPVTKGTIQHQREMVKTQGADLLWMGHVHEDYEVTYPIEYLNHLGQVKHKNIMGLRTAAYKEEYEDGHSGFHVERGRPVKPLGGRWLDLNFRREGNDRVIKPLTYKTEQ
mgnify:CR=1 FL=1